MGWTANRALAILSVAITAGISVVAASILHNGVNGTRNSASESIWEADLFNLPPEGEFCLKCKHMASQ